ncbi:hypothetical protein PP577_18485 [Mycobacteroides abscessus]|nr:hypothetical protein [Mycobacteroides abscessus]MDM2426881.1 hypothetical protein [Mycobacteroides abscessus]MDM2431789.1 hypothetical protein [Mycobacteroides abscessus]MDM2436599.1 hypothetical protein [Mycobacteroides abscessus]MDM2438898.1 hypothetical protein [Mycobacteroides abscessus]
MNPKVVLLALSPIGLIAVSGFVPFPLVALIWIASGVNGWFLGKALTE